MAFEKYILSSEGDPHMSAHQLGSLVSEYARGEKTKLECLAAIEAVLDVTLTTDEKSDLQALMNAIDAESGLPAKLSLTQELEDVCLLSEQEIWYTTKALLKTRFGWI